MALNASQLAILKADIAADPTLNSKPNNSDGNYDIAAAYNLAATPDYFVWSNSVAVDVIYDNIVWANLTPTDAPDTTQQWLNRAMMCQGKQFNLQTMLQGKSFFDAGRATFRAGLQDALTNVPSGAAGATVSAGWVPVKAAITRKATRIEKLFASGSGSTGTPSTLIVVGPISYQEVDSARNS